MVRARCLRCSQCDEHSRGEEEDCDAGGDRSPKPDSERLFECRESCLFKKVDNLFYSSAGQREHFVSRSKIYFAHESYVAVGSGHAERFRAARLN